MEPVAGNLLKAPLTAAGVWQCDTGCDLKRGDGIIRRGRFRSARASASASLRHKLATEGIRNSFHQAELKGRGAEERVGEKEKEKEQESLEIRATRLNIKLSPSPSDEYK